MKLEIIKGDITTLKVDVIVNAANKTLLGGEGVDGAIHKAAGPALLEECKELRRTELPNGLPTGEAVMTSGYDLPSRFVIHTVGPVYGATNQDPIQLANAYRNSLKLAEKKKLTSIAFPAISTGVYGYPKEMAARVVKKVLEDFEYNSVQKVILCYFSAEDKMIAQRIILT
ncbi:MAG: O-acetyl-ADP-ribose deacetylase [Candidatus Woesearchaeota archaeon]